jgi:hypothetical protein
VNITELLSWVGKGGGEIHVLDCSSNSANKGVAML